jgi:hypothetical protein
VRELERALVFRARLVGAAEAAEQVGSRGVEVLVAVEVEPVDEGEASFGPAYVLIAATIAATSYAVATSPHEGAHCRGSMTEAAAEIPRDGCRALPAAAASHSYSG